MRGVTFEVISFPYPYFLSRHHGERSIDKLKEGLIYIKFNFDIHYSVESNSLPQSNKSYTMIETTAYFESYKYVLEALVWFNNSNHDEFPFNTKISKPKYLENAFIDFRY